MSIGAIWTVWCDAFDCLEWAGQSPLRSEALADALGQGWQQGRDSAGHLTGRHYCPAHHLDHTRVTCGHR